MKEFVLKRVKSHMMWLLLAAAYLTAMAVTGNTL